MDGQRLLSPALHLIAVALACAVADPTGIREATIASCDCRTGELRLAAAVAAGDRVLIAEDLRPIGWATLASGFEAGDAVRLQSGRLCGASRDALSAWIAPADALASLAAAWPPDAAPHAVVETVAPGGRAAWVRMPPGWDIAAGERFWRRAAGGQPLIRLDARFAEGPLVYCDVVPLAQDAQIREGDRVALWRDRGEFGAASAVCFVEERSRDGRSRDQDTASEPRPLGRARDGGPLIWIAAPHHVECPEEPRVEIRSGRGGCGRVIADGIVERRGGRFWFVRLDGGAEASAVRVGDDVVVRTDAMLAAGRFAARIFESRAEGHLITAGEPDGLRAGQTGVAWRDGAPLMDIRIVRLQRGYSVIRPAGDGANGEAAELRVGDEVRFSPPPQPVAVVGHVVEVVGGSLLAVRMGRAGTEARSTEVGRAGTEARSTELGDSAGTEARSTEVGRAGTEARSTELGDSAGTEARSTELGGRAGTEARSTEVGRAGTEARSTEVRRAGAEARSTLLERAALPASPSNPVERASVPASQAPLLTPLAVRDENGVAAVAVLLAERDGVALGFAIEESIARPPAPGMRLEAPVEAPRP